MSKPRDARREQLEQWKLHKENTRPSVRVPAKASRPGKVEKAEKAEKAEKVEKPVRQRLPLSTVAPNRLGASPLKNRLGGSPPPARLGGSPARLGGSPAARRVLGKRAPTPGVTAREAGAQESRDHEFLSEAAVDGARETNDKPADAPAPISDTSIHIVLADEADGATAAEESPGPSREGLGSRISDESSIRACSTNILDGPSELECTDLDCAQLDLQVDSLLGDSSTSCPAVSREPSPMSRLWVHVPQAPAPTPERAASSAQKVVELQRALDVLDLEVSDAGAPPNSPLGGSEEKSVSPALQSALDRLEEVQLEDSVDASSIGARRLSGMSNASESQSLGSPTRALTFSAQMETVEEAAPAGPAASPALAAPVAGGASAPGCAAGSAAIDAAVEQRFDEVNKENSFLRDRVSALERKSAEQSELIANMMETHNELYQIVSLMANQLEAPPRTAGTGAPPPGWRGDVTTTAAESGLPERLSPVLRRRTVF